MNTISLSSNARRFHCIDLSRALPHCLDLERAGGKCSQKILLRPRHVDPRVPVSRWKDGDLPIVIGRPDSALS
jgi:hypothetical protein